MGWTRWGGDSEARGKHWGREGVISLKATALQLPRNSPEDFVIARLACLIRASPADKELLQTAWSDLSVGDRRILMKHFLADGTTWLSLGSVLV